MPEDAIRSSGSKTAFISLPFVILRTVVSVLDNGFCVCMKGAPSLTLCVCVWPYTATIFSSRILVKLGSNSYSKNMRVFTGGLVKEGQTLRFKFITDASTAQRGLNLSSLHLDFFFPFLLQTQSVFISVSDRCSVHHSVFFQWDHRNLASLPLHHHQRLFTPFWGIWCDSTMGSHTHSARPDVRTMSNKLI